MDRRARIAGCSISMRLGKSCRSARRRGDERQSIDEPFLARRVESSARCYVESPSPPRVFAGEKVLKADEGAFHADVICARAECDDFNSRIRPPHPPVGTFSPRKKPTGEKDSR